jgi:hypothetical protein
MCLGGPGASTLRRISWPRPSMSSLSANTISDLIADVQTIRAQLNKTITITIHS